MGGRRAALRALLAAGCLAGGDAVGRGGMRGRRAWEYVGRDGGRARRAAAWRSGERPNIMADPLSGVTPYAMGDPEAEMKTKKALSDKIKSETKKKHKRGRGGFTVDQKEWIEYGSCPVAKGGVFPLIQGPVAQKGFRLTVAHEPVPSHDDDDDGVVVHPSVFLETGLALAVESAKSWRMAQAQQKRHRATTQHNKRAATAAAAALATHEEPAVVNKTLPSGEPAPRATQMESFDKKGYAVLNALHLSLYRTKSAAESCAKPMATMETADIIEVPAPAPRPYRSRCARPGCVSLLFLP